MPEVNKYGQGATVSSNGGQLQPSLAKTNDTGNFEQAFLIGSPFSIMEEVKLILCDLLAY